MRTHVCLVIYYKGPMFFLERDGKGTLSVSRRYMSSVQPLCCGSFGVSLGVK